MAEENSDISRLTDRQPLLANTASNNLQFYVVDQDDDTEHPDGSSYQVSKAELVKILGIDLISANKPIEHNYLNTAELVENQEYQTVGFLQYVTTNKTYYEYLGFTTGNIATDYRTLTAGEAVAVTSSLSYRSFTVSAKSTTAPVFPEAEKLNLQYNGTSGYVTDFYFNTGFSSYLAKFNDLKASFNFSLVFYNKTQTRTHIASITAMTFTGSNCKVSVGPTILNADILLDASLELSIMPYVPGEGGGGTPIDLSGYFDKATYDPDGKEANAFDQDNMNAPSAADTSLVDADEFNFKDATLGWFRISYANMKANFKAYFDTVYVLLSSFLEEKISGSVLENTTATGSINLSANAVAHFDFTLTGNTSVTITDLPAVGKTKAFTGTVKSTTTQTFGVVNATLTSGEFKADGTKNTVFVNMYNTAVGGLQIITTYGTAE
ncbi:hypothetical protein ACFFVB_18350 [Formosa undariae]|uniref:Uncharacterized protein n=1 Tax=Formosa undariae TaxID=1325436 RepID=A0ABV5F6I3_9FLAO